jgi:hypothetical protein
VRRSAVITLAFYRQIFFAIFFVEFRPGIKAKKEIPVKGEGLGEIWFLFLLFILRFEDIFYQYTMSFLHCC